MKKFIEKKDIRIVQAKQWNSEEHIEGACLRSVSMVLNPEDAGWYLDCLNGKQKLTPCCWIVKSSQGRFVYTNQQFSNIYEPLPAEFGMFQKKFPLIVEAEETSSYFVIQNAKFVEFPSGWKTVKYHSNEAVMMPRDLFVTLFEPYFDLSESEELKNLKEENARLKEEREAIQNDSRILTCAFCGHQYPPNTPESNFELLRDHVLKCTKHPLYGYRLGFDCMKQYISVVRKALELDTTPDTELEVMKKFLVNAGQPNIADIVEAEIVLRKQMHDFLES